MAPGHRKAGTGPGREAALGRGLLGWGWRIFAPNQPTNLNLSINARDTSLSCVDTRPAPDFTWLLARTIIPLLHDLSAIRVPGS